jgi:hypothetical protein
MADQHGKLYDEGFGTKAPEHGGAKFDEGFPEGSKNQAHGPSSTLLACW